MVGSKVADCVGIRGLMCIAYDDISTLRVDVPDLIVSIVIFIAISIIGTSIRPA